MERNLPHEPEFIADDARRLSEILEIAAREDMNGNFLEALVGLSAVGNFIEATKTAVVAEARAEHRSWAEIGDALGTSKQTAFNRYSQGEQK